MAKKKLSEYRAKRDFTKTSEPSGAADVRPAKHLRFVIQKHDASHLHYDLRLELDGVFKSWAVTRGASIDPKDKRLAVEVEDHPLDYGDFEGTIPKGQYGGGTVMLWDRGFWAPVGDQSPEEQLRKGELKFVLVGDKLNGSWVLVKIKNDRIGGKRNNWLLIKHRDEGAHTGDADAILSNDRSVASKRTMAQIAAGQGKGPEPFIMRRRTPAKPNAVWNSNKSSDEDAEPEPAPASTKALKRTVVRKAVKKPKSAAAVTSTSPNVVLGIAISHPEKVLWPADDHPPVTKLDLAHYLETAGPWMLEHIKGRPCSVIRAPDGINGEMFFQRHAMKSMSPTIDLVRVSGDREPYIEVNSVEALIALGQIASLEFHPWNCVEFNPDVPGRLVFDLDPAPDVEFSRVVRAANELRDRLEKVGLVGFCKTTGGKGLHVVTPLKTNRDASSWTDAKTFAGAVCQQMAADSPSDYLIKMTKKLRNGKIFLDYFRNDRMATAVAPLSPRARPGATVSMPLTWSQVKQGLDPKRYTVHTVPALLKKMTAWEDYDASERSLKSAIKMLIGS